MKQVNRNKPKGETGHYKIRTFSYNDVGEFFIVHADEEGKERIFCLNENETRRMIKFIQERLK
jgi:hypothetical protein